MPTKRKQGAPADLQDHSSLSTQTKRSSLVIRDLPTTTNGGLRGSQAPEPASQLETPKKKSRTTYQTPTKAAQPRSANGISTSTPKEDRSTQQRRTEQLVDRQLNGDLSDDASELDDEDNLVGSGSENGNDNSPEKEAEAQDDALQPDASETPAKRGRGRPKGWRRPSTPPLPPNLPGHELYFYHHRLRGLKTSNNTLPTQLKQFSHAAYHEQAAAYEDPHAPAIDLLHALHTRAFPQWLFELSEGFSVLLHGYGSKRRLLADFAKYVDERGDDDKRAVIVMADADHAKFSIRGLLATLAQAIDPNPEDPLPISQPALLAHITTRLQATQPRPPASPSSVTSLPAPRIYVFLSNITAAPLQHAATQSLLASLVGTPTSVRLLATTSLPTFPLLWPAPLLARFAFAHHDATTFVPYDDGSGARELGGVVDGVRALLGRRGAGATGREGVRWVLRSLPENARGLYRVLVAELLALDAELGTTAGPMDRNELILDDDDDDYEAANREPRVRSGEMAQDGVPFQKLYQRSVEEFLCSSEMAFRTLLKEFHDHHMVVSRRDASGSEVLAIPLEREELEGILEDLTG